MSTNTSGPDLLGQADTSAEIADDATSKAETHPLHILQQEIAAMPAIDQAKVEATLRKIQNGTLGILGNEIERLASEQRIATKIIEETELAQAESTQVKIND